MAAISQDLLFTIYELKGCGMMFTQCLSLYYHLFYYMEDNGILNPDDVIHLFALHYIYLVRINNSLASKTAATFIYG